MRKAAVCKTEIYYIEVIVTRENIRFPVTKKKGGSLTKISHVHPGRFPCGFALLLPSIGGSIIIQKLVKHKMTSIMVNICFKN